MWGSVTLFCISGGRERRGLGSDYRLGSKVFLSILSENQRPTGARRPGQSERIRNIGGAPKLVVQKASSTVRIARYSASSDGCAPLGAVRGGGGLLLQAVVTRKVTAMTLSTVRMPSVTSSVAPRRASARRGYGRDERLLASAGKRRLPLSLREPTCEGRRASARMRASDAYPSRRPAGRLVRERDERPGASWAGLLAYQSRSFKTPPNGHSSAFATKPRRTGLFRTYSHFS